MPDISVGSIYASLKLRHNEFDGALRQANARVDSAARRMETDFGRVRRSIGIASTAMMGVGVAAGAMGAMFIKAAASMEQNRIAFTSMLRSGTAAEKMLKDLQRFAATTPFEFTDLVGASRKMLALGFAAKDVLPSLTSIGDAVSAMGGGSELLGRVVLALGQMGAKGKVSGEEMRQMAEAGIPAWKFLADAIGKTTGETMKLAEKGVIPADLAIKALLQGMSGRFGGMMAKQAETAVGQFRNLKDQVEITAASVGDVFLPKVTAALKTMNKSFSEMTDEQKKSRAQWIVYGGLTIGAAGVLTKITMALPGIIAGLKEIRLLLAMPIGKVGIVAAAAAIVGTGAGVYVKRKQEEAYEERAARLKAEIKMTPVALAHWEAYQAAQRSRDPSGMEIAKREMAALGWRPGAKAPEPLRWGAIPAPTKPFVRPLIPFQPLEATKRAQKAAAEDPLEKAARAWQETAQERQSKLSYLDAQIQRAQAQGLSTASLIARRSEIYRNLERQVLAGLKDANRGIYESARDIHTQMLSAQAQGISEWRKIIDEIPTLFSGVNRQWLLRSLAVRDVKGALAEKGDFPKWEMMAQREERPTMPFFVPRLPRPGMRYPVVPPVSLTPRWEAFGERLWDARRDRAPIGRYFAEVAEIMSSRLVKELWRDAGVPVSKFLRGLFPHGAQTGGLVGQLWRGLPNFGETIAAAYTAATGQAGGLGGAMAGAAAGAQVAKWIPKAPGWLGPAAAGAGALFGLMQGDAAERKQRHQQAQAIRREMLRELRKVNNALTPVSDYFRGLGLNLLPSRATFGSDYAMASSRGVR